jgi:hypothetical protein
MVRPGVDHPREPATAAARPLRAESASVRQTPNAQRFPRSHSRSGERSARPRHPAVLMPSAMQPATGSPMSKSRATHSCHSRRAQFKSSESQCAARVEERPTARSLAHPDPSGSLTHRPRHILALGVGTRLGGRLLAGVDATFTATVARHGSGLAQYFEVRPSERSGAPLSRSRVGNEPPDKRDARRRGRADCRESRCAAGKRTGSKQVADAFPSASARQSAAQFRTRAACCPRPTDRRP